MRAAKSRTLLFVIGALGFLVITVILLRTSSKYVRFLGDEPPSMHARATLESTRPLNGSGFASASSVGDLATLLEITYPEDMKYNETKRVMVTANFKLLIPGLSAPISPVSIEGSVQLSLSGPAFEVGRKKTIKKEAGTPLPLEFIWDIMPEREGRHGVSLELHDILGKEPLSEDTVRLRINEQPRKLSSRVVELPIEVYTMWGISRETYGSLNIVVSALSFLLMYPLFHEWIKNRWSRRNRESSPVRAPAVRFKPAGETPGLEETGQGTPRSDAGARSRLPLRPSEGTDEKQ